MANLTITVEDDLLKRARIRALEQGTSVNALLRHYLENFAGKNEVRKKAIEALIDLSCGTGAGRGKRSWTRQELHER